MHSAIDNRLAGKEIVNPNGRIITDTPLIVGRDKVNIKINTRGNSQAIRNSSISKDTVTIITIASAREYNNPKDISYSLIEAKGKRILYRLTRIRLL